MVAFSSFCVLREFRNWLMQIWKSNVCECFGFKLGETATETYKMLRKHLEAILCHKITYDWFKCFNYGRSVDHPDKWRPSTFIKPDNVWYVILKDLKFYGMNLSDELNVRRISDEKQNGSRPSSVIFSRPHPCNIFLFPMIEISLIGRSFNTVDIQLNR